MATHTTSSAAVATIKVNKTINYYGNRNIANTIFEKKETKFVNNSVL